MPTLTEAARTGDKRGTLMALRDLIAAQIESCESGRDMAALSKRLMEVMAELDSLGDPDAERDEFDEVLDEL